MFPFPISSKEEACSKLRFWNGANPFPKRHLKSSRCYWLIDGHHPVALGRWWAAQPWLIISRDNSASTLQWIIEQKLPAPAGSKRMSNHSVSGLNRSAEGAGAAGGCHGRFGGSLGWEGNVSWREAFCSSQDILPWLSFVNLLWSWGTHSSIGFLHHLPPKRWGDHVERWWEKSTEPEAGDTGSVSLGHADVL